MKLEFSGKFAEDMSGLYRSTYTDENGKVINILATQFEVSLLIVRLLVVFI